MISTKFYKLRNACCVHYPQDTESKSKSNASLSTSMIATRKNIHDPLENWLNNKRFNKTVQKQYTNITSRP
jgi:hypothetical protein